jgi:hypothetical protein
VATALDTGPNADKQRTHAPCVAILRWNCSTAGTAEAAGPICVPAAATAYRGNDAATGRSTRPRPAAHGRESARRAEADAATSRGLVGAAGDTGVEEERDLWRRRAEATLYMEGSWATTDGCGPEPGVVGTLRRARQGWGYAIPGAWLPRADGRGEVTDR